VKNENLILQVILHQSDNECEKVRAGEFCKIFNENVEL